MWAVLVGLGWCSARNGADDPREQIFRNCSGDSLRCLRRRLMLQPQRNYTRGEVLVQLADETVVAARLVVGEIFGLFVINVRSRAGGRRKDATMTVRRFDCRTVENKDDQQQAEATREACVSIVQ